ncbi:MAG: sigma 54-interacting transcriptional regulator [Deltaproteobacteria bacterium]
MGGQVLLVVTDDAVFRKTLKVFLGGRYELVTISSFVDEASSFKVPADLALIDAGAARFSNDAPAFLSPAFSRCVILGACPSFISKIPHPLAGYVRDFVRNPLDKEILIATIERCLKRLALKKEILSLRRELERRFGFSDMLSVERRMKDVFELTRKVSETRSNVLITGESGTGKELVAKAIHRMDKKRKGPFIAINSAAVPTELVESELFGYEKGAFTGAVSAKPGKLECAAGGTLFLDEIGTLPLHTQAKLLRVLQDKTIERLGGNSPVKVDIRIIAATNINLEEAVRVGGFRQDLYYRLKVVPIELPPLRERKDDIPLLVEDFLEVNCGKCGKRVTGVSDEAMRRLIEYQWPGNVRELENMIERLTVEAEDFSEIGIKDIPFDVLSASALGGAMPSAIDIGDYRDACRTFEKNYIISILNKTNWNRVEAAAVMKVHRNTLFHKMKEFGIEPRRPARRFSRA